MQIIQKTIICIEFPALVISISRHTGTIVGHGEPTVAKGHRLVWAPLWDPRHLIEAFSFHSLAGPIFHRIMQIALSSNNILFVYIAYLISLYLSNV